MQREVWPKTAEPAKGCEHPSFLACRCPVQGLQFGTGDADLQDSPEFCPRIVFSMSWECSEVRPNIIFAMPAAKIQKRRLKLSARRFATTNTSITSSTARKSLIRNSIR